LRHGCSELRPIAYACNAADNTLISEGCEECPVFDALSNALSGIDAASARIAVSAHNIANLTTESFHPQRVVQRTRDGGGVDFSVQTSPEPREVDLAREFVDQIGAKVQFQASLRVIGTDLSMKGSLLDLFA
jgi:flagellar hook protein FlgE